jgi:hypothetical protein
LIIINFIINPPTNLLLQFLITNPLNPQFSCVPANNLIINNYQIHHPINSCRTCNFSSTNQFKNLQSSSAVASSAVPSHHALHRASSVHATAAAHLLPSLPLPPPSLLLQPCQTPLLHTSLPSPQDRRVLWPRAAAQLSSCPHVSCCPAVRKKNKRKKKGCCKKNERRT